ncbi:hypothetical protein F5B19DRAFT_355282 [Rostrohypoxylon terebratum]|nr:hypothetical protein F5B19DRAFT_355282 [Rostrohypoxylon terebratum]
MSKPEIRKALSSVSSLVCKPSFGSRACDKQDEPLSIGKPLPHAITSEIVETTQKAIEWYRRGAKLWTRFDLEQVESELAHYQTVEAFSIRRIDGKLIYIDNPMYGIVDPIWKPRVKFQHYWDLFQQGPDNMLSKGIPPAESPYYSYFIEWENQTYMHFLHAEHRCPDRHFREARARWEKSWSCDLLKDNLAIYKGSKKITKVLCFGLGDITPLPEYDVHSEYDREFAEQSLKASLNQHVAALTIANALRAETGKNIEIFAQDPAYSYSSKGYLEVLGIKVIGDHGAGGFSKINSDTVVFFCFPSAPVRQIIADMGRPAIIIGNGDSMVLSENQSLPFPFDAESPRTRQMWKEYTKHDFRIAEQDEQDLTGLTGLSIYVRNDVGTGSGSSVYSRTESDASIITLSKARYPPQDPISLL